MIVLAAALATTGIGWLAAGGPIGPAFAAGAGLVSLEMLLFSLLGLPWHPTVLLPPWVALAGWRVLRGLPKWERPARPSWIEWTAIAAILVAPALWLPYERVMPLSSRAWDAWAIWLFKAKAFTVDGGIAPLLSRAREFNHQPSYPLLVPLYASLLMRLGGEQAGKAVSALFFFALLGSLYGLARRFSSRPVALVFTALLANLHMVDIAAFELAGYADTALSVYLLLGAGHLYAWYREERREDLIRAAGFAGLAAWTKNEGLFFFAAVAGLVIARRTRAWVPVAAAAAVTVAPWWVLRRMYDVPGADLWTGRLNWTNLSPGLASFGEAFNLGRYNLTFWLLAAALIAYRRAGLDRRWLVLPGLVAWQLAGLLGAYLAGRNDLQWWIGTSLDRILAQVAPLALVAVAVVAGAIPESQPAPAPAPAPGRRKRR